MFAYCDWINYKQFSIECGNKFRDCFGFAKKTKQNKNKISLPGLILCTNKFLNSYSALRQFVRFLRHMLRFVSAGFLSDVTSTYNEAFFFSGAAIALCTCVLSLVPVFSLIRTRVPTEIKMTSDNRGERERIMFKCFEQEPCEVVEYFVVVDRVTVV